MVLLHRSQLSSTVVVPLLVLAMFAHRDDFWPWTENPHCYNAIRYRQRLQQDGEIKSLLEKWEIPSNGTGYTTGPCITKLTCQTFRCKDYDRHDVFVINTCSKFYNTCHEEFYKYCERTSRDNSQIGSTRPECTACYGQNCNKAMLQLENHTHPKPEDCSGKSNCCYNTFRYDKKNQPNDDLFTLIREWGVGDFEVGKMPMTCPEKRGCQTYRCRNADQTKGDFFVYNGCAIRDEKKGSTCSHNKLDKFCPHPHENNCVPCRKNGCNGHNTERVEEQPKTTTTQSGGIQQGTGKSRRTKLPPKAPKFLLHCLAKRICERKEMKKSVAKLSRQFIFRSLEIAEDCQKVMETLSNKWMKKSEDARKNIDTELWRGFKFNQRHGRMLMEDYIKAIVWGE